MSNLNLLKKFMHDWELCYSLVKIESNLYKITPLNDGLTIFFIDSLLREFSPDGFSLTSDRDGDMGIFVIIDQIKPKNKD